MVASAGALYNQQKGERERGRKKVIVAYSEFEKHTEILSRQLLSRRKEVWL